MAEAGHALWQDCQTVMRARRARAMRDHAAARRDAQIAAAAMAEAEAGQVSAAAAWQDTLAMGFDPDLGTLLARRLVEAAALVEAAGARVVAATRAGEAAATRWQAEETRCAALDREQRRLRTRLAARAEERRLATLADRLTFNWRRS